MYSLQVNRTSPDKVYTTIRNVNGDSITAGLCARYLGGLDTDAASADGISAIKLDADANWQYFAGVAITDIASDEYGIVQSWGYSDAVSISAEANKTIGPEGGPAGTYLKKGAVAGTLTSQGTPVTFQGLSTQFYRYVQIWDTVNASGGIPQASCWIRAF
jgi:hypothetical protein